MKMICAVDRYGVCTRGREGQAEASAVCVCVHKRDSENTGDKRAGLWWAQPVGGAVGHGQTCPVGIWRWR